MPPLKSALHATILTALVYMAFVLIALYLQWEHPWFYTSVGILVVWVLFFGMFED